MSILRVYNPSTQSWDPIPYIKGDKGDRGYDVTTVEYEYYSSTSSSEPTGGEWSTIMPGYSVGRYIWVRTKTTNSHGDVYTGTPVLATLFNDVNSAELIRRTYETNRVNAETARDTAEGLRDSAEIARASAELLRASAETSRGNSEVSRANAEAQRVSAESSRVLVEAQRVANEGQRISNENARIAAQGRYPIVQNDTWWVWSKEDDDYVDTEVTAVGADGVGIASIELTSTVDLVDTYTITFDDGNTTSFNVTNGADGISPTITVTEITGGHEVAVTDAEGTQTFDVLDGEITSDALEERLIDKADIITSSASGEIVTISDGGDDLPVVDLSLSLLPVQDLHGQANPYPAGGGTNLRGELPLANDFKARYGNATVDSDAQTVSFASNTTATDGDKHFPDIEWEENTQYTFIFTCSNSTIARSNLQIVYTDGTTSNFPDLSSTSKNTVRVVSTANKTVRHVVVRNQGGTTVLYCAESGVFKGNVALSAYAPYSNVCPISGWTGVDVRATGKNLLDMSLLTDFTWNASEGAYKIDPSVTVSIRKATVPYKNNTQYAITYTARATSSSTKWALFIEYTDGTRTEQSVRTTTSYQTFSLVSSANKTISRIARQRGADTGNVYIKDWIIAESSVAVPYEPFGQVIPIDWTSTAGTLYEVDFDVTTGDLSKKLIDFDMGNLEWEYDSQYNRMSAYLTSADNSYGSARTQPFMCDIYKVIDDGRSISNVPDYSIYTAKTPAPENKVKAYVHDSRYTNAATFKTDMAGHQIVIKRIEPFHFQLSGIQMSTLLGINNIWMNANGTLDLEYRCDTKLYIENLTKPSEDDMVANQNITASSFFMVGNRLFLSTVAIAQGATIIPGTNCTEISLADALNSLNS